MNNLKAKLYIQSNKHEKFYEGAKTALEYLNQDGNGMKGLQEIIEGIESNEGTRS